MITTNWKVCWSACTIVHRGRSVVAKPVTPYVYLGLLQIWKLERRQQVACSQDGAWVCSWLCCTVETAPLCARVLSTRQCTLEQRLSSCLVEEELRGQPVRPRPCLGHTVRKASLLTLTWPTITWQVVSGVQKKWSEDMLRCSVAPSQEWDVIMIGNKKGPLYPTWVVEASMAQKGLIVTIRSSKYTTRHYCQKSVLPWFSFGFKKARARVVEPGNMPIGGQRLSCKEQRRPQNTT